MENIVQTQQLKAELRKVKDIESDLRCENQQLKTNLQHHISETDNLIKKLEHIKQKETEYNILLLKLENGKKEVNTFKLSVLSVILFLIIYIILLLYKMSDHTYSNSNVNENIKSC